MSAPVYGPYATEADARQAPVVAAVDNLDGARSQNVALQHLLTACAMYGADPGAFDERMLRWLAGWEAEQVAVVIGLISRAYAAGQAATAPDPLVEHPPAGLDFAAATAARCRWAQVHGVSPSWSSGERLAVALVLRDGNAIHALSLNPEGALQALANRLDMTIGETNAWCDEVRAAVKAGA